MVEKDAESRNEKLQRDHILIKQISPGIIDTLGKGAFIEDRPTNYLSVTLMYGIHPWPFSLPPHHHSFAEDASFLPPSPSSRWPYIYLFDSS